MRKSENSCDKKYRAEEEDKAQVKTNSQYNESGREKWRTSR